MVRKCTHYFYVSGGRGQRTQFPLQNAFALTVHKTQGLTLPHVTIPLDEEMFSYGQAYVALSRALSWAQLSISSLSLAAFRTDPAITEEYERLQKLHNKLA